jgi:hypothetical protein
LRNEQMFCDRCGKLLYDKKQGIEETRHQLTVVLGYSAIGEWGYREDGINYISSTGFCLDCFYLTWLEMARVAKVLGREMKPIRTYSSSGKFYEAIKRMFKKVRPY